MITKKKAKEIIEKYKNNTCYFNKSIHIKEFENMLYHRMGFGLPETEVIIASLIFAGAKFKEE